MGTMKSPAPIDDCENHTLTSEVGGAELPRSQAAPLRMPPCAGATSENEESDSASLGRGVPQSKCLNEDAAVDIGKASAPPKHPLLFGEDATLPVFTSRDEEIEFASQPIEEIVAAEADVLGLTEDMARVKIEHDLQVSLTQLEAELALLPDAQKAAYVEATRRCPEQIGEEHKKAFLWREEYDTKLAAVRMAKYWERRRALFGEEKCYLPFTLAGALRGDGTALRHCMMRIVPNKDEKGRGVVLWDFDNYPDVTLCNEDSMLRACWYTLHVASRDAAVRERGLVILFRPTSSFADRIEKDPQQLLTHLDFSKSILAWESDFLPIVVRGLHWCKANRLFHLTAPVVKAAFGKRMRSRFKVHYGSDEEVLQKLEEYGLPRDHLPSELGGDLMYSHDQWLADRLEEEYSTDCDVAAEELPSLVKSSFLDCIAGNDQAWEPIRIGSNATSALDMEGQCLKAAAQLDQDDVSLLEELESASSVRRKSYRQMHLGDPQGDDAKHKPATTLRSELRPNETLIADNIVSTEADIVSMLENESLCLDDAISKNDFEGSSKIVGRRGDPRMNKAVKSKLENPDMSAEDALLVGGFVFPNISPFMSDKEVLDTENMSLAQRKHQLRRRLRKGKKKYSA